MNGEYYVAGDLHGVKGSVRAIRRYFIQKLSEHPGGRMILLGDYIDRGGYEKEVLTELYKFKKDYPGRCYFLLGNHDFILLDLLYRAMNKSDVDLRRRFLHWWKLGGFTTIRSFASKDEGSTSEPLPEDIWPFLDNFAGMIKFYNFCVGKIKITVDLPGRFCRQFRLTHAGPRERDMLPKDPDRRIWSRWSPQTNDGTWIDVEKRYLDAKQAAGRQIKNINIFGHTVSSEADITGQFRRFSYHNLDAETMTAPCFLPVDAGGFHTGILAVASLLQPGVDFLRYDKEQFDSKWLMMNSYSNSRLRAEYPLYRKLMDYFRIPENRAKYQHMRNPLEQLNTTLPLGLLVRESPPPSFP